jgi:hypothetical protein
MGFEVIPSFLSDCKTFLDGAYKRLVKSEQEKLSGF